MSAAQEAGCEQAYINISETLSVQAVLVNEHEDLLVIRGVSLGQRIEEAQYLFAIADVPTGKFADYEWMRKDFSVFQQPHQRLVRVPKMIDPDRCVDKDHG
jgi:hypothetical protein